MNKKIAIGAAAVAASAGLALGVTSLAEADPSTTPTSSATATAKPSTRPTGAPHSHTPVTGDELTKVTNAVKAKVSGVTVNDVQKDEDGSYDVKATKADGTKVKYDVSADLATVTEKTGRRGGKGRGGGHAHTAVTGAELTKVTDAVKAKYSGITIDKVLKDPDGSYDVHATKADGSKVMIEVSADLGTITEKAPRPRKGSGTATPTPTP